MIEYKYKQVTFQKHFVPVLFCTHNLFLYLLFSHFHITFDSNTMGTTSGAGITYCSSVPELTLVFFVVFLLLNLKLSFQCFVDCCLSILVIHCLSFDLWFLVTLWYLQFFLCSCFIIYTQPVFHVLFSKLNQFYEHALFSTHTFTSFLFHNSDSIKFLQYKYFSFL